MQDKNKIVKQFIKERVGKGIIDALGDGISIQDTDLNILYQNKVHKEIIGDHQGEICYKAYEKREQVCDGCPVVESFRDGETHTTERTATTDKGIITVEITASPLRDLEGVIIAGIEIVRDITAKKELQDYIIQAKKDWEDTFDIINEAITIHDKDFNIIRANKAAEKMLELPLLDIFKKKCFESYHGSNAPTEKCPSCHTLKTGEPTVTELYEPHLNKYLEIKALPRFDENQQQNGIVHVVRDITARKLAEDSLRKREHQLAASQRVAHLGSWEWDIIKNKISWSDELYRIFGLNPQEFEATYEAFLGMVHPDDQQYLNDAVQQSVREKKPYHVDARITRKDGTEWVMEARGEITVDEFENPILIGGTAQDITNRKQMEEKLSQSNQRLFSILNSINAFIYVADMETYEILFVNKYGEDIFGDIVGQTCWKALQQEQPGPCEFCTNEHLVDVDGQIKGVYTWEFQNTANGRWYYIHDKAIKWEDGRIVRLEIATDITDRKRMEEELREATMTDYLTGLLNRRGFFTLAKQQGKLASRIKRAMALLYLDLDGFKNINDELGHDAGDKVLLETANILKSTFREADILARIGGDEFAVLLTDVPNSSAMNTISNHLQDNIRKHNEQRNLNYKLILSSGVAYFNPEQPCSISKLLDKADNAMYYNKHKKE
jgi:diguanylate cyclase (GGDEF)-like protein/PAS domain S-box-containing protein